MIPAFQHHTEYDLRFQNFLNCLMNISRLSPRQAYLYRFMDTPAFSDFETALSLIALKFTEDIRNDLQK